MRNFTDHDYQAIEEAEKQIRAQGKALVIEDDANGTRDLEHSAGHNGERIGAYFAANPNIPVTIASVLEMFRVMDAQFKWKSSAQVDYETTYNQLSKNQQENFGAWWFRQKSVLKTGDEGYSNAAKIIGWMRGKTFDPRTFDLAVSNLASSHGLHWAPSPQRVDPRQRVDDGKGFMPRDSANLSARDHAARREADAAVAAGTQPQTPATDFKKLAEAVTTGRTHGDSAKLSKMFVMQKNNPSEIDWAATASARQRLADGKDRR